MCITTLSEERMYAVAKKRQFHGNDKRGINAKHSEKPADLAPGRARLTPRWMTAPDSSGTPWHDLAQGKVTVCYFVLTSHTT